MIVVAESSKYYIHAACLFLVFHFQHAKRMRRIMLVVACLALLCFPHYLIKGHDLRKKGIENTIWVFIFSVAFLCKTSHSKKKSMTYYHKYTWYVQVLRSPKETFAAAMQSWRERCEKCVCLQGDYVEK